MYGKVWFYLKSKQLCTWWCSHTELVPVLEPTAAGESRKGPLVLRVCRKHLQWWLVRRCILKGYDF